MNLIQKFYYSFKKFSGNRAFCINGQDISYAEFHEYINGARELLEREITGKNNPVGIVCFECIETYAAIFATWFSGNYFIPVNPKHPLERNMAVVGNTGARYVFSTKEDVGGIINTNKIRLLNINGLKSAVDKEPDVGNEQRMYVLTTSGSTGVPKYVPINLGNVTAYCTAFMQMFPELKSGISVLQTHDHTTDAAFTSYLLPLLAGACIYTLPEGQFKFLSIARLMSDKKVNWVKLTPSVLTYLSPYIPKLDLKHILHFGFGGEALPLSLVQKWRAVFPNAEISNFYGPTEATMNSTFYKFKNLDNVRALNGTIAIGKPFPGVECVIIDGEKNILGSGKEGELCIAGKQIMSGYLNSGHNPFVFFKLNGEEKKFYRTGDIVRMDKDGYYYFIGRVDDQVKIEGYRVNLIEVENAVRNLIPDSKVVAVAHEKIQGLKRLYIFIEGFTGETGEVKQKLIGQLPGQMVPEEIFTVPGFPFTSSGKVDRRKLEQDYLLKK
ncbi:MAG: amino acid adenylation domain-containing protein [Chlorobi bacterium]|nr:amino acid adenylation domain-containing protein [Chlorobiota bacterium]